MNKGGPDRAAQFLPFDSLKGLQEELRKREALNARVPKKELSDEQADEINSALAKLERGAAAEAVFYCGGHYLEVSGKVTKIDPVSGFFETAGVRIYFDDLISLKTPDR